MGARSYSQKTIKILFGESGNLCAYPECNKYPIQEGIVLCDIAHILPASDKGPRSGKKLSSTELNKPSNLLLFCLEHHRIVDAKPELYEESRLKQYKADHIKRVKEQGIKYQLTDEDLLKAKNSFDLSISDISESQVAVL